jgi:hypothetical protein
MTDAILDDEDEYEEALGPSLAIPPLYLLRTADRCPECGRAMHVYTLGCTAFHDREDSRPVEEFHFLRMIESVPDNLLALLRTKCVGYYPDREDKGKWCYLMNHCRCGARLDDDYLHGDVGAAFWPDTPDGYESIKLFLLPVDEPIPVVTSFSLGGGEYLDIEAAAPWGAP